MILTPGNVRDYYGVSRVRVYLDNKDVTDVCSLVAISDKSAVNEDGSRDGYVVLYDLDLCGNPYLDKSKSQFQSVRRRGRVKIIPEVETFGNS